MSVTQHCTRIRVRKALLREECEQLRCELQSAARERRGLERKVHALYLVAPRDEVSEALDASHASQELLASEDALEAPWPLPEDGGGRGGLRRVGRRCQRAADDRGASRVIVRRAGLVGGGGVLVEACGDPIALSEVMG